MNPGPPPPEAATAAAGVPRPLRALEHDTLFAVLAGPAERLVAAIRDDNGAALTEAFDAASEAAGGDWRGAAGLAMVIAACYLDEHPDFSDCLRWVTDKDVYRHAIAEGLTHAQAVHWTLHTLDLARDAAAGSAGAAAALAAITTHRQAQTRGRRLHIVQP